MRISDWSSDVCSSDLAYAGGGACVEHGLPGLVAGGQGHGRARGRPGTGCHGAGRRAAVLGADAAQHPAVAGGGDDAGWLRGGLRLAGCRRRAAGVPGPPLAPPEIGLASCRERVCPYVWTSVVAVVLQKKKTH